jgi:hypothetical protein
MCRNARRGITPGGSPAAPDGVLPTPAIALGVANVSSFDPT